MRRHEALTQVKKLTLTVRFQHGVLEQTDQEVEEVALSHEGALQQAGEALAEVDEPELGVIVGEELEASGVTSLIVCSIIQA